MQPLAFCLFGHDGLYLALCLRLAWHEHKSGAIPATLGYRYALQQDKLVWNLQHDAGTIAILAYFGSTVAHVFQHPQCVVNNLVTSVSVQIHNHANATRIVLILVLIKPIIVLRLSVIGHIVFVFDV